MTPPRNPCWPGQMEGWVPWDWPKGRWRRRLTSMVVLLMVNWPVPWWSEASHHSWSPCRVAIVWPSPPWV